MTKPLKKMMMKKTKKENNSNMGPRIIKKIKNIEKILVVTKLRRKENYLVEVDIKR